MSTATDTSSPMEEARKTDVTYALVGGLYVTALVLPGVMFLISRAVTDAAGLYVSFLVLLFTLIAVSGWGISRTDGIAARIGSSGAVWFLIVVPVGWLFLTADTPTLGVELPPIVAPLTVFGGVGGMFLGFALVGMSRTRHTNLVVNDDDVQFEWEARWPPRWRRVARVVSILAFGGSAIGLIAAIGFGFNRAWRLYYLMFVAIPLMFMLNPRTFQITPHGLVVGQQLQRRLHPWAAYSGYSLTEDAFVIHTTSFWRPAHRCDRSEVSQLDVLKAELDRYLPPH